LTPKAPKVPGRGRGRPRKSEAGATTPKATTPKATTPKTTTPGTGRRGRPSKKTAAKEVEEPVEIEDDVPVDEDKDADEDDVVLDDADGK
jgi:hypothetical protein